MINRLLPVLLVASALAVSTGCPNRPQAPLPAPSPASVTVFSVEPKVLPAPGEAVVLEWGTSNALDVTIEQVGKGPLDLGAQKTSGRLSLVVEEDTIFLITAQGAGGSDVKASSVTVTRRARSVLFSAVPSTVEAGAATTLVWNAPGAKSVKLEEVGGAALDVGMQLESGSVRVTPNRTSTYRLQADNLAATTTVTVAPTVVTFTAGATVPSAGEPVVLSWTTVSATSVTLRRVGLATPLPVAAGQVAVGSYTDTVPGNLPADAILTYVLEVSDGTTMSSKALEVPVGGGVRINTFTAPAYALSGSTFPLLWTTVGGESAELIVDGRRAYLAQSRAEVANGSYTLSAPTQSTRVEFIVRNNRGAEAREARTIEGVGPIAYNFFRTDKTSIAAAGEAVTLSWSVTNARAVRITNNMGAGFYRQFTGTVDSGSLVVLPNSRPPGITRVTYRLEADNGTGSAPIVRTVDVDVGAPSAFTFSRQLPVRAPTTVTGTTLGAATQVSGFRNVEKNPPGEAFVDIRRTGTAVAFGATTNAGNVLLPSAFEATLFGTRISRTRLNVSRYGWFHLSTASTEISGRPGNDPQLGTALEPFTIAPYWNDLVTAAGQVHWRIDGVSNARRLIVQWTNVRPTTGPVDARLSFQAQLFSDGRVVFAYRDFFKVQGRGTVGVVNGSESDEAGPTVAVAAGEVYRLFAPQAVPAPLRIEATPFAGLAVISGETMEAEGAANYPLNQFVVAEVSPAPPPAVANGQWVELANNSDAGVDISGWDLDFGGVTSFQFPMGTTLPASGRLLVGQAADLNDPETGPGIVIDDGGIVARPRVDVVMPSTVTMPRSGGFARLGIGGTEYTRLAYGATTVGASFGPEDLRAPWLTYSTNVRIVCDAVRYSYGSQGQTGSPGLLNPSCWPYRQWEVIPGNFTPIASAPGAVALNFGGSATPDTTTAPLDLTLPGRTPLKVFGLSGITAARVAADGYIVFGGSTRCCDNFATPATTNNLWVAPWWDDLQGRAGGGVYFLQTGTPPNVETIISWENWTFFPQATYTGSLFFQVRFKPNGDVEYHYGPSVAGAGADAAALTVGSSASVWIEAVTAADIFVARTDDANVPTVNPLVPGLAIRYRPLR